MRMRLEELPADMRRQAMRKLGLDRMEEAGQDGGGWTGWTGREKDLQAAVERMLAARGWMWFHMPGAAAAGNPRGWPDLMCFGFGGRVELVELKTARGKVSDLQEERFKELLARGHEVHVCRSVEEVERVITAVGA